MTTQLLLTTFTKESQVIRRRAASDVLLLTCEGKGRNTKGMLRNYM